MERQDSVNYLKVVTSNRQSLRMRIIEADEVFLEQRSKLIFRVLGEHDTNLFNFEFKHSACVTNDISFHPKSVAHAVVQKSTMA